MRGEAMLVKQATVRKMYSAGNKKAKDLLKAGVPLQSLTTGDNRKQIESAIWTAFKLSDDRSSGHDADHKVTDFLELLDEEINCYGKFTSIVPGG